MKKTYLSLLLLFLQLLTGSVLQAQNISAPNRKSRINLSLWKNVATQRTDTTSHTWLNLGISSSMNQLSGVGVNLLASITGRNTNGLQVSGITNVIGNNMLGVSISGLVNITGNHSRGISLTGLTNIVGQSSDGLMLSGLLNLSGEQSAGVHIAGMSNIHGEDMSGIAISGLLNMTANQMTGVQLSALGNISGNQMTGAQIGVANIAVKARGVQIGVVNYYRQSLDGFQLGLINANPKTRVQLMIFGGNHTKLNVGARFKNELFYTILGMGTHYLDFNDKFSASLFYRAGLELPLYKQLYVSGDLGFQHIETFKNKHYDYPARLYGLQARINLEYHLTERFSLFLTSGYGGNRYYNKDITFDKGIIWEAGLILLRL
ncbi:MAG: hypothetical protein IJ494_03740 [Bacteroides sp.]|nr:hypothetical protein [Bacteroides sp.]